jgi:hypothetical protein
MTEPKNPLDVNQINKIEELEKKIAPQAGASFIE